MLNFTYDRLEGGSGNKKIVEGGFRVEGVSNPVTFMYTSKISLFGGNLGGFLTTGLTWQRMNSGGKSQSKTGLGNLIFGVNLNLKRDWKTFGHVIEIDLFASKPGPPPVAG